ncbi:MAG TPA: hypothetical protein VGE34_01435 [Candidatus Saccharimonadales bacterium]
MKKRTSNRIKKSDSLIVIAKSPLNYVLLGALLLVITLACVTFILARINTQQQQAREMRIVAIYDSLKLGDSYRIARQDIFGDVRVNPTEEHGIESSVTEYGKDATRSETFNDLEKHITQAGFTKTSSSSASLYHRQDHYKNDKGEYIRVSIETSAVRNSIIYGTRWPKPQSKDMLETGPVYVTIDVNLDDINKQSPLER